MDDVKEFEVGDPMNATTRWRCYSQNFWSIGSLSTGTICFGVKTAPVDVVRSSSRLAGEGCAGMCEKSCITES